MTERKPTVDPADRSRKTSAAAPDAGATMSQMAASIQTSKAGQAMNPHSSAAATPVPKNFGRYKIEKELGKGAMGVVYLAEDTQLHRKVALKIPKKSSLEDPETLERFYREARTTATLRHANICPVYDVGDIDGTHYLTMAYIPGKPVSSFLGKRLPAARQVALLIRKIALALEEAHKNGVVHRDLKPSNVMLDDRGEPIVMDFGLACQTNTPENARLTQSGAILGTPAYMAPEQVRGDVHQIGPASDIYSLGVMLYQLLTGELPFTGPIMMVFAQIITEQPRKPSEIRPDVDPTLEAICLKMMSKEIDQRYGSMKDVVAALTEYLKTGAVAGLEPTATIPPTTPSVDTEPNFDDLPAFPDAAVEVRKLRSKKKRKSPTARKSQWFWPAVGTAAGVLLMVLFAVVIVLRNDKVAVQIAIDDPTAVVKVDGQQVQINSRGIGEIRLTLDKHSYVIERNGETIHGPESFTITKDGKKELDLTATRVERPGSYNVVNQPPSLQPLPPTPVTLASLADGPPGEILRYRGHTTNFVHKLSVSPDGRWVVSGDSANEVHLWEAATGRAVKVLGKHVAPVQSVSISADGTSALSCGGDMILWDLSQHVEVRRMTDATAIRSAAFTTDARNALVGADFSGNVSTWNLASGEIAARWKGQKGGEPVFAVAVSPVHNRAATGGHSGNVIVWDLAQGTPVNQLDKLPGRIFSLAFSQDGSKLLTSNTVSDTGISEKVRVWDVAAGKELFSVPGHIAALTPDGQRVLTHGEGRPNRQTQRSTQLLYDLPATAPVFQLDGFDTMANEIALTADGRLALLACQDGTIRLWRLPPVKAASTEPTIVPLTLFAHLGSEFVFTTAVSPDGKLVAGGHAKTTRIWNAADGSTLVDLKLEGPMTPRTLLFSPDNKYLVWGGWGNQEIRLYDVQTGEKIRTMEGNTGMATSLWFSADGKQLLSGGQGRRVGNGYDFNHGPNTRVWNVETGKELRKFEGNNVSVGGCWLADGRRAVSRNSSSSLVRLWDTETGKEELIYGRDLPDVWSVALSPNQKYVAASLKNDVVLVWEVATGQQVQRFEPAGRASFTPDGERILCSSKNGASLRMWDVQSGAELLRVEDKLPDGVGAIHAFPAGERALISTYSSGHVYTIPLTAKAVSAGNNSALRFDGKPARVESAAAPSRILKQVDYAKTKPAARKDNLPGPYYADGCMTLTAQRGFWAFSIGHNLASDQILKLRVRLKDGDPGTLAAICLSGPGADLKKKPGMIVYLTGTGELVIDPNDMWSAAERNPRTMPRVKHQAIHGRGEWNDVEILHRDDVFWISVNGERVTSVDRRATPISSPAICFGIGAANTEGTVQLSEWTAYEAMPGQSPASSANAPADAISFGQRQFKLYAERLTWHEAQAKSQSLGGRLAESRTKDDNEFLYNLVRDAGGVDGIWLGATDEAKHNTWVWQDGSPVVYTNWDKGQPNNFGGAEHYVMLLVRGNTGKWWDQPNESGLGLPKGWKTGFVCEWDAPAVSHPLHNANPQQP